MGNNYGAFLDGMRKAKEYQEILDGYGWIKVPKFEDDLSLPLEERYLRLNIHHVEETNFLINKIREIVRENL